MRVAPLFCVFAFASMIAAQTQIPIPGFGSTFTSTATRGLWFQTPVPFVITGLRVPNEANHPAQAVEVIDLQGVPPPAYPATTTATTQLFFDNTTAAGVIIPCAIPVAAGQMIGVLGVCNPTQGSATSANSYGTPSGAFASNVLGNPITLARFGTQSGIASNGGNQPVYQIAAGTVSRIEIYIVPAAGFASKTPFGSGCGLVLDASARPVLGTSFSLTTTNIPAGSPFGSTLLGFVEITNGIDLTGIGMPGCHQYLGIDASVLFLPAGGTGALPFALPNDPGLAGVSIVSQSATITPGANPLGVVASNGLRLVLDIN